MLTGWAEARERAILISGRPLNEAETALAKRVGVKDSDRVRILGVPSISLPDHPMLSSLPAAMALNSPANVAQTLEYGISIGADRLNDRSILAHELTHVAQYERLGGIEAFLTQYLQQIVEAGYEGSSLEKEAFASELLFKRLN